jgi:hypothetical protein
MGKTIRISIDGGLSWTKKSVGGLRVIIEGVDIPTPADEAASDPTGLEEGYLELNLMEEGIIYDTFSSDTERQGTGSAGTDSAMYNDLAVSLISAAKYYGDRECPDCLYDIPEDAVAGSKCSNCDYVFQQHDDT